MAVAVVVAGGAVGGAVVAVVVVVAGGAVGVVAVAVAGGVAGGVAGVVAGGAVVAVVVVNNCIECERIGKGFGPRTPEIEAVLMHGRDYLALMTPENRALLVEALDNLEAVTR